MSNEQKETGTTVAQLIQWLQALPLDRKIYIIDRNGYESLGLDGSIQNTKLTGVNEQVAILCSSDRSIVKC